MSEEFIMLGNEPEVEETAAEAVEAAEETLNETAQAVQEEVSEELNAMQDAETVNLDAVDAAAESTDAETVNLDAVQIAAQPAAVQEPAHMNTQPVQETPVETVEAAAEPEKKAEKKSGKGLKIAIIVLLSMLLLAVLAVGALILKNGGVSVDKLFGSDDKANVPFTGVYIAENGAELAVSAGGKAVMSNQTYDLEEKDGKLVFTGNGKTYAFDYEKTEDGVTLIAEDGKQTTLSAKEAARPARMIDVWENMTDKIEFREDGTASIGGTDYDYTADGYEIICTSFGNTEYLFYELDGDKLTIFKPDSPTNTQTFFREGTGGFESVGVWVAESGEAYYVISEDGQVKMNNPLADMLGITIRYADDRFTVGIMGIEMGFDCTIDGDVMTMKIEMFGDSEELKLYRVTTDVYASAEEIDRLWKQYAADNGIDIPSDTDLAADFEMSDLFGDGLLDGDLFGDGDFNIDNFFDGIFNPEGIIDDIPEEDDLFGFGTDEFGEPVAPGDGTVGL